MLLAFDIGNTFVKYGIYRGNELLTFGRVKAKEIKQDLFKDYEITNVAISSVVPKTREELVLFSEKTLDINPFVITPETDFNLKIDYRTPKTLGLDRVCGAEGAYSLVLKEHRTKTNEDPIITVDFGTATTVNLVSPGGVFNGGIIAPGINTMIKSLFNNTAQLPEINLNEYHEYIGKDTNSAIASGIMNATVGLIEKTLRKIESEYKNKQLDVFLTGGNAPLVKPYIDFECFIVNDLVLKGVNSICKLNYKNNS